MNTVGVESIKIIRAGYDILGFATKGEMFWKVEIYESMVNLRAILLIHPDTEQVHFVAGPWDAQSRSSQPNPLLPRKQSWASYELSGHFRASVSLVPIFRLAQREEGTVPTKELPRVYYISCKGPDLPNQSRTWQRVYDPNVMVSDERLYNFKFGPVDEHRFCFAFMQGVSVYFHVLDSRTNLPPIEDTLSYEDYETKPHRPQDVKDDPARIDLQKILDRAYHVEACKPEEISIDGISACGERRVLHLTLRHKVKLTLLCPLDHADSDCVVCTYPH